MKNKKIEKILDKITGAVCALCLIYGVQPDSPALKRICELLDELEYALQEIRNIANEGSKSVFADEDCDKILAKINEVIGAE